MKKLYIRSVSDKVKGQGVDSAFKEQRELLKLSDKIDLVLDQKQKWDILHIHTFDLGSYFLMRRAKARGVKVIVSCHVMPDSLVGSLKIPRWVMPILVRYMLHFYAAADRLVVVNPFYKEALAKAGLKAEKIEYVPNYVSGSIFHPIDPHEKERIRQSLSIRADDFVVVGAGQVQKRKGIDDFVKTATLLPEVKFVWVGGFSFGKLTDGYAEFSKIMEHPPANLQFTGIVDREQVAKYFQASDVLFLPSYQELFPMTVLEAANCHLPLLLRDIELYRVILDNHYRHAKDAEGFAQTLQEFRNDPSALDSYRKESQTLSITYSQEYVLKLWENLYLQREIWYNNG